MDIVRKCQKNIKPIQTDKKQVFSFSKWNLININLTYHPYCTHFPSSPGKKVAYCRVQKIGSNSWGNFFAMSGRIRFRMFI